MRRKKYVYLKSERFEDRKRFENGEKLERILNGILAFLRIFATLIDILLKLGLLTAKAILRGLGRRKYVTLKN